jgi:hypothetical protein
MYKRPLNFLRMRMNPETSRKEEKIKDAKCF